MKQLRTFIAFLLLTVAGVNNAKEQISVPAVNVEPGSKAEIIINCEFTSENITLYQLDLYLPVGITLAKNDKGRFAAGTTYKLSNRHDEHTATIKEREGFYRIVVSNNDGYTITSGSGELLRFTVDVAKSVNSSQKGYIKQFSLFETNETEHAMVDVSFDLIAPTPNIPAVGISLDKTSLTFTEVGETVTLTATVSPNNATDRSVTWKSSNSAVATVDANGKVTAVANGTATITATTNDGSNKSASCTVTVEINEETEIEISNWRNDVIAENTPVASYTDESLDNYDWVLYSPDVRANGALQIADGKLTTNSGTVYAINPGKKNALVLRKANSPQTLNFTTPVKCGKIYFITISAEGASTLEAVVNYDDGSKESAKQYSVPDWYSTQSDQGEVIYGLGRINRASNEFADVNYFRIFEYLLPTNANKKVKSITFTNTSSAVPTILGVTTADKTVEMHVVTYEVLYDGKLVATATRKVADGSVLPEPPSSLTNSYVSLTKYGTHPTKVTKDVTVKFTATWNGPFEFSKDDSSAKWYNMHIHNGWYVGKQNGEPYYPKQNDGKITQTAEYLWAFGGDPYHVKVYNRTTDFTETLSKDGENAVMRSGDYTWDLLSNDGGFVLRETGTDYNCINQFGGADGPLKFWNDSKSLTDVGSIFRVEEAQALDETILANGITLSQTTLTFTEAGETVTLTATVSPNNATDRSVTWKSSNSAVATVDANGKVTAVANGTATITATTNDGSNKSASCTVTVEINEETEIEISNWRNDVIAENTPVASYTDESLDNYDWVLYSPDVRANGALQIADGKLTTNSGTVYAINPGKKNALVLRKANSPQTLNFTTPVKCGKIYFITISAEGASTLEAVVNYDDGSKESAKQYSVPDWYSTQSDQGEVIYGLGRINRASNEFADVNYFRIFEYLLPTNANKKVKSITFTNTSSAVPTILGVTTADKTVEMHVVTYEVLYDGKLVATATRKVADGSVLPEPPSSLTNSYVSLTKYGTHPTKVTKDVTVKFTATWNGPFEFSKDDSSAKWYNMHIHNGWYVGKQNGEPYYPKQNDGKITQTAEYLWAFGGDPYHVKVYNRTTDFTETLSKDGENAVMRSGDYTWDLLSNDGGFVLRETGTDYNCINQFGGADGPLKFWNDSKSLTDVGSIFRVEEAQALDETILANGITLSQTTLTFTEAGETVTLTATVSPNNATDRSVTWKSSNSAVATVDANGKVTAVANGTATITATTNDGSNKSASCTVTVEINEETEIEISNWRNDVIAENTPVASYTDESLDNYDWVLYSPDVRANGALQIADGKLTTNSGTVYAINPGKKNALVLRKANSPQTLNFTTPVKCGKIYFITISAEGASTLEAVVNYDDGSKESAKQYSVPDWYSTQSDQGEVIYGLGRINRASNEFADVNYFRIFEYLLPTNANKKVKSITFTNTSSAVPTILGVTTADKTVEMHVVTYEVLYDGKLVATATRKVADGSVLPEPPSSLTNSYVSLTKYGTHPTKVTKDVTVKFTATWNGPFEFSKDDSSAKWYNMHIHNGWYVGKQNGEPYYPKQNDGKITQTAEYLWAFGGDPYHVKVYNYTTGFAETLTKDGENAVMRLGDYSWDILPNSDGFVLRETGTDYNCINQYGGAGGPLKFWYNGNSPTDNASTFRVEEAMDIVDGIESFTPALSKGEGEIYDLSGRKMGNVQSSMFNGRRKGVNIIRMSDGTIRKVLIK